MKKHPSRKPSEAGDWPRKVTVGHVTVTVYKRRTPTGGAGFMVANHAGEKRRFDCYAREAEALDAAQSLAVKLNGRQFVAAGMSNAQASDYASAVETLVPFKASLPVVASTVAECLKLVGDLPNLHAAAKFYAARHKRTVAKPVSAVVAELLAVKEARNASPRYLQDLRFRLGRFADAFRKDACNVTTAEIQAWLDSERLAPQSYENNRRVIHLLFRFATARGYASDNPVAAVERVRVKGGDVEIFTPAELARLLSVAPPDFLPALAIGGFAGLRSAEIERLQWSDIDLAGRHIVVGATRSKTAARRVVPICDALAQWLAPYTERQGMVWPGTHDAYYQTQLLTAAATEVKADPAKGQKALAPVRWKSNALRHSYASYRFAQIGDAGRVAGECGNSAAVIHRHYRELVKPADAERWFNVKPEAPANVTMLHAAQ